MTKTLTEQWCEGELDEGWYYVVREWDDEIRMLYFESNYFLDTDVPLDNDNIKEVVAPVPTYEEWQAELASNDELLTVQKRLEKRLEIATKALKEMVGEPPTNFSDCETYMWAALQALKEMEGVK